MQRPCSSNAASMAFDCADVAVLANSDGVACHNENEADSSAKFEDIAEPEGPFAGRTCGLGGNQPELCRTD